MICRKLVVSALILVLAYMYFSELYTLSSGVVHLTRSPAVQVYVSLKEFDLLGVVVNCLMYPLLFLNAYYP